MDNRLSKFLILSCLAVSAVSILFVLGSRAKNSQGPANTPPVVRANPANETAVQSSDGKLTLTMKEEKSKGETIFIFWISRSDGAKNEIFRKTLPSGSTMMIPANTFSPDNKYVFLKEDLGRLMYLVLSTTGTSIIKDSQFLEFSSEFEAKYPNYKITEAIGWGGPTLIVINVDKVSGGQGPSFWFDVGSRSFIQLTNRFN